MSDQTKEWLFDWLKGRKETIRLLVEVVRNIDGMVEGGGDVGGVVANVTVPEATGKKKLRIFFFCFFLKLIN